MSLPVNQHHQININIGFKVYYGVGWDGGGNRPHTLSSKFA